MPSYYKENDIMHLETEWIDDIGLGLINGDAEVYCSSYYNAEENSHFSILYIRDKNNYIGHTYIRMDSPDYQKYNRKFSLDSRRRDELYKLLTEKQFYGISGWEMCMRAIEHECGIRNIDFAPTEMPDYRKLPVKEEGFLTDTEKRYCEELGEYESLEDNALYEIEHGIYIVGIPLRVKSREGFYFKVMKVDMSDPEAWFEDREIISWCRISMEKPEYITGYDECMTLTDEQIDKMIAEFHKEFPATDYFEARSYWSDMVRMYANDFEVCHADVHIEVDLPMPDYTLLKGRSI